MKIELKNYFNGFIINSIDEREEKEYIPIDIKNQKFKDDANIAIYNKYTKYSINEQAKNFKELIEEERNDYLKENFRKLQFKYIVWLVSMRDFLATIKIKIIEQ